MNAEFRVLREFAILWLVQRARQEPDPALYVLHLTEAIRAGFDSVQLPESKMTAVDTSLTDICERASRMAKSDG